MSRLPKKMLLPDFNNLKAIAKSDFERQLVQWIHSLYDMLQKNHQNILDFAEAGGMSTADWDIKQATAADVANGDAVAAGNLLTVHKTSGTKSEIEA